MCGYVRRGRHTDAGVTWPCLDRDSEVGWVEGTYQSKTISLLGKQVFNIASVRVSKIYVYNKNNQSVTMLCKKLCTLHFA